MSDQRSFFEDFIPIESNTWTISGIGDKQLEVVGKGNIKAVVEVFGTKTIRIIHNVLYVPGLGTNLFSIGAATDFSLEAQFRNDLVLFYRGKSVVLTVKRTGNTLYLLDMQPQTNTDRQAVRINQTDSAFGANIRASLSTWHQRLGHSNHRTVLKMVSHDLLIGLNLTDDRALPKSLCESCESGKFHRVPLLNGRTRAKRPGDLVHSDVRGPLPCLSLGKASHYVLFTDDYSGWRVIYFLK